MQGACRVTQFLAVSPGGSGSASWVQHSCSGLEEIEALIRRLAMPLHLLQLGGGNLGAGPMVCPYQSPVTSGWGRRPRSSRTASSVDQDARAPATSSPRVTRPIRVSSTAVARAMEGSSR